MIATPVTSGSGALTPPTPKKYIKTFYSKQLDQNDNKNTQNTVKFSFFRQKHFNLELE